MFSFLICVLQPKSLFRARCDGPRDGREKKINICQRSLVTEIFVPSTVNFETVENADPASDFSSLIQGTKDAAIILSVTKPCRKTNVPI